jgi:hypothetical protein
VAREGIRAQRPNADNAEVERQLHLRIALGRGSQTPQRVNPGD